MLATSVWRVSVPGPEILVLKVYTAAHSSYMYTDIVLVSAKSATSIDAIQTAQHYIVHLASSLVANSVSCHVTRWLGQSPEEHEFPRRSAAFHQRAHPFER